MVVANKELRMLARGAGVPLWQIAEKLGCSDQKLFRDWRKELRSEEQAQIREIIIQLQNSIRGE